MSPNGRNCRPNRPLCAKPCGWRRGWADSWDAKATANPGRRLFGLDCNALMIWPGCTWYCAVANDRRCPAIEDMGNDQPEERERPSVLSSVVPAAPFSVRLRFIAFQI